MKNPAYHPISCAFYDELEARATTRQVCTLHFREGVSGSDQHHVGVISELFIDPTDRAEYLRCADGFTLRLDLLTAVDDRPLAAYC